MSIQYSSLIGACKRWCSTFPNNKNPDKPTVLHSFGAIGLYQHMNLSGHHENIHRYDFDPLKPHFYIVKLGFAGVYIIFVISAQKHRLWWGGSNEYPQSMFLAEIWKISEFFIWKNCHFLVVKFSVYLNKRVFVMIWFTDSQRVKIFLITYAKRRLGSA